MTIVISIGYFDIPKRVTKEELQSIEGNVARGVGDIYTYEEYWDQTTPKGTVQETNTELSQTVPKDAAASPVTYYSHCCHVLEKFQLLKYHFNITFLPIQMKTLNITGCSRVSLESS